MKKVVLSLMCTCLIGVSHADVLISDAFNGAAGALNGATPDIGSDAWSASANLNTDGSTLISAGTGAAYNGFLSFSPEAGYIYTLSADVDIASGSDWVGIGFTTGSETDAGFQDYGAPWILYKDNAGAGAVEAFGAWIYEGSGTKVSTDLGDIDISGTVALSVILDTTESITSSAWSMYVNGTQVHSGAWGANPTITGVGLGVLDNGDISATVDNFTLTRTVPEPATLSMVAIFGGSVLFIRRRLLM